MIRHEQRPAGGGHVLDALVLDPEPVAVVEVENRLGQLEEGLRAAPVVDVARRVLRRDDLRAFFARGRGGLGPRELVDVRARVELGNA